jgi:hypothetical protein
LIFHAAYPILSELYKHVMQCSNKKPLRNNEGAFCSQKFWT